MATSIKCDHCGSDHWEEKGPNSSVDMQILLPLNIGQDSQPHMALLHKPSNLDIHKKCLIEAFATSLPHIRKALGEK